MGDSSRTRFGQAWQALLHFCGDLLIFVADFWIAQGAGRWSIVLRDPSGTARPTPASVLVLVLQFFY